MESKTSAPQIEGIRPILTLASQEEFADALRMRRLALGLTLAELDHLAGFHDGYASHLERPFSRSGKRSFKLTEMATIWLDSLGLAVTLSECTSSALGARSTLGILPVKPHPSDFAQRGYSSRASPFQEAHK